MYFTADLHIHSHYAAATSKFLNLETLYQWAMIKGVHVIGTGDFTHPAWFGELKEKLLPDGNGFFLLKDPPKGLPYQIKDHGDHVRFCLSTEINCETFEHGKSRRVHNLVYAPDFESAAKISRRLSKMCDLTKDGRPTVQLSSKDLLEITLESSPHAYFVPAHIWTPWFSLLGSAYGYDSVEQCFGALTPYIFALETSLSADPVMCNKLSGLDRFTFMSNSDAHSMANVGREINRFDTAMNYYSMFEAVRYKKGFLGTYEFIPSHGKYYYDGHRNCKVSLSPERSSEVNHVCPACSKGITIGTLGRSEELADRKEPGTTQAFEYIIPLSEILSGIHGVSKTSKKIDHEFSKIISSLGNELEVLHEIPIEDIRKRDHILALAVSKLRNRQFHVVPGYDGQYGKVSFFNDRELEKLLQPQISLF